MVCCAPPTPSRRSARGQVSASLSGLLAIHVVVFSEGALYIPCFIAQGSDIGEAVATGPPRADRLWPPGCGRGMDLDLPLVMAGVLAVAVLLYRLLGSFDLGVAMLLTFARRPADRDRSMRAIAPMWDGTETWLVLDGGGLRRGRCSYAHPRVASNRIKSARRRHPCAPN